MGVVQQFAYLVLHKPGLCQAVKVEVVQLFIARFIHFADSKGRAGHTICTAQAARQATYKGGLAAA